MSQVLSHVIASIGPASEASGETARAHIASAGVPMLERLARGLAAAQHTSRPRGTHRRILVAAGDHGCGDPGIAMGADHPTVIAARTIADGTAALCQVARAAATPIVLVDAGVREPTHMPGIAVQLGRGPSRNLIDEPALTVVDATLGLEAGIALAMSLSEDGLDLLALGALGVGSEVASAALLGAATGQPVMGLRDDVAEAAAARGVSYARESGLERLATFGGPETALLAGVILGSASINVPVILDGYATGAAALIAAALAPPVTGYLVAAHRGTFTMPAILAHLGLEPIFDVGLGHGEGTGAAMLLPMIDQVIALV
ncbi:MAG TPA: nicotinate-nucleotide--dimethylbenzimidazole phosphoribosyltransferase [Kofleriaceae bacterium]|nr:nicotinate-nucleotide--dimethylbenzimidazole phosphoribosyltransferase [Kofleriaceae bacterium]